MATLVTMTGYGVYLTAGVLYFTRAVHLPAGQVGAGLTIAGAVSLAAGIPFGHLADRHGARTVYALTLVLGAISMTGLCLARDFWSLWPSRVSAPRPRRRTGGTQPAGPGVRRRPAGRVPRLPALGDQPRHRARRVAGGLGRRGRHPATHTCW
ncbi:hypothetical protein Q5425_35555 [Amycolatopsis sp. A133]|uniref:MFS transporter n=1 Tax=Amycolatopsis sp. A133 TaxID=3064472 RepID=UPI0027F6AA58|nr:MFS transporter [Amycolatopsis sp. A133]MDQ7809072.1 hypothetical protein [Amycolatopsis sp. A133]